MGNIVFSDLFDIEELQNLQDLFADATGVASVITRPDGTPVTKPSNFSWLNYEAAAKPDHEAHGEKASFAGLCLQNRGEQDSSNMQDTKLWYAAAAITVGGVHMADWLIGKVRTAIHHEEQLDTEADENIIPGHRFDSKRPGRETTSLQLDKVSKMLSAFVREISDKANQNLLLMRQVSEQEKATQQIRELYENLSTTLSSIGDGVITTDLQGLIVSMNPVAGDLCGWDCREAVGRPLAEVFNIFHAGTWDALPDPVREVLETAGTIRLSEETILISRNDGRFQITESAAPIRSSDGHIYGVILVFSDVSDNKAAHEKIIRSEKMFHSLYNHMVEGAALHELIFDKQGIPADYVIVETNPAFETQLGIRRENVIGKTSREAYGVEEPPFLEIYSQVALTQQPAVFETYFPPLARFFSISAYCPYPGSFATIFEDITDRKMTEDKLRSSEEQYRLLLENAGIGVCVYSLDGRILLMNQKAVEPLGGVVNDYLGKSISEVFGEEYSISFLARFKELSADNKSIEYEYFVRLKTGNYWYLINISTVTGVDGKIIGVQVLAHDITLRKETEAKLMQSEEKYRQDFVVLHSLLESPIDIIIFSLDKNYCYTAFTQFHRETMKKIWGVDIHLGMNMLEAISTPDDRLKAKSSFDRALQGEYFIVNEEYGDAALYRTFYDNFYSAIKDPLGNIIGVSVFVIDVTSRRQAMEALRKSEQHYRILAENISDVIWILDPEEMCFSYISPSVKKLLGYTPEEVMLLSFTDILKPEIRATFLSRTRQRVESFLANPQADVSYRNEVIHLCKDGSLVTTEVVNHYYLNEETGRVEIQGVSRDITDQKLAEKTIKDSEEKFRKLVREMQVVILLQGPQAEIVLSNPKALELLGLTEDQLMGKTSFDPDWNVIHEDGSPFPGSTHPVPKAIETRSPVHNVIMGVYRPLVGDRIWLLVDAQPQFDHKGKVLYVICSFRDISKRIKAEKALHETNEYLENLINYANAPIIVWDPQFRITRFNHAFELLTGYREASVLKKSLEILFPPALATPSMELIHQTLTGEHMESAEIGIMHRDGSVRTVLWNSATIFTPDGLTPVSTIAQGQDITARKQAEAEITLKNQELVKINAEKDKFFSIIAHDLRSPFNAFLGFTRMLAEDLHELSTEEIQKIAITLRKSASSLYDLLENLLEWSKLQRKLIQFNPETGLLNRVIRDGIQPVAESAQKKSIDISISIQGELVVFADKYMFGSIMRNLVSNAVKFTPKGGKITINAKPLDLNTIEICISDSGIGMSKELIHNLFSLDQETNRRGTENEPTTGLGLIICREFIEKHGGNLSISSEEGSGSRFCFTIPMGK